MPQFTTDRFLLRPICQEDLRFVFQGLGHEDITRHYPHDYRKLEDAQEKMDWYLQLVKEDTGRWFAVMSLDNEVFYGAAGFSEWDKLNNKARIEFWLIREYWRRGVMREVVPVLCNWGFRVMGLFRIEAYVESKNKRCLKVLQKTKFTHEGVLRAFKMRYKHYIHIHIYSILFTDDVIPFDPFKPAPFD